MMLEELQHRNAHSQLHMLFKSMFDRKSGPLTSREGSKRPGC